MDARLCGSGVEQIDAHRFGDLVESAPAGVCGIAFDPGERGDGDFGVEGEFFLRETTFFAELLQAHAEGGIWLVGHIPKPCGA